MGQKGAGSKGFFTFNQPRVELKQSSGRDPGHAGAAFNQPRVELKPPMHFAWDRMQDAFNQPRVELKLVS